MNLKKTNLRYYHHEQYFGNAFERKEKYCCGILINHKRKGTKAEQSVTLDMARYLKSKDIDVVPGKKFCRQCKSKYNNMSTDEDSDNNSQCTTMSDQEFNEGETPKKKLNSSLQSMGVSPMDSLHAVAQHSRVNNAKNKLDRAVDTLKNNLCEAYSIEFDQIDDSKDQNNSEKNEFKEKAIELDRLHEAMKDKLITATYAEKLQILTLAPDSWSREHCAAYFGVSEYLIRRARELKKVGGILNKPNPKQGKTISNETINLVKSFFEDDEYGRQLPGKKDCVSIGNGQHMQKRLLLCNLQELFVAFKDKNPNEKIGFSKFCSLRPKWCLLAGAKGTHSVCVCSAHQNAKLLVEAINWKHTYKDLMGKIVCSVDERECMMHRCENCPRTSALTKFFVEELIGIRMRNSTIPNGIQRIEQHYQLSRRHMMGINIILILPSRNLSF